MFSSKMFKLCLNQEKKKGFRNLWNPCPVFVGARRLPALRDKLPSDPLPCVSIMLANGVHRASAWPRPDLFKISFRSNSLNFHFEFMCPFSGIELNSILMLPWNLIFCRPAFSGIMLFQSFAGIIGDSTIELSCGFTMQNVCIVLHNEKKPAFAGFPLSGREDSNFRPLAPHASTLANCATPRLFTRFILFNGAAKII